MSNEETPRQETPDDPEWEEFLRRMVREAREHGFDIVIINRRGRLLHSTTDDMTNLPETPKDTEQE